MVTKNFDYLTNKMPTPVFARCMLIVILSLSFLESKGSHIVGGVMTYAYLGDTTIGTNVLNKYQVSLSIYEDCLNGLPSAIAEDNPAFLGVFDPYLFLYDTNINCNGCPGAAISATITPVPTNFNNACVTNVPPTCLEKRTFVTTLYLPPNATGYLVAYQRCCRNAQVQNIIAPADSGATYYCTIPAGSYTNNSAVFKNYPPQIICVNNPLIYDNSATDADGDSLSYGFCSSLTGANDAANSKPAPTGPPYDSVTYVPGFSAQYPVISSPQLRIDPVTGLLTGTPTHLGRYLVSVFCDEYRHGVRINRVTREFQFVVTNCSKTVVADIPEFSNYPNTYIVDCRNYTVNFANTSVGGFTYHWNFGVQDSPNDTSDEFQPTYTYPDTGTYLVELIVNPGSTCSDSISRFVKIYPYFIANFSDSGKFCSGDTISFTDLSSASLKPITNWEWFFGDGDSTFTQNPIHTYHYGGTYNVILMSQNEKDCADTALKQVIIDNFKPFAGNDTIIVKGSSVPFNATGGLDYTWSPGNNLNNVNISNPLGYYPDTGLYTYQVHVISDFGCSGYDTITVTVVNQAEFAVPNAFTPNSDGKNDLFRPIAVGYRSLNYFRVYNRWGQQVYYSTSFDAGWNGTFNNKDADIGTYYWEISYTDRNGKEGVLKGDVILVR